MPIAKYFKGHGSEVMADMMRENHGNAKEAKSEFYATANKTGMKPANEKPERKTFGQRIAGR